MLGNGLLVVLLGDVSREKIIYYLNHNLLFIQ